MSKNNENDNILPKVLFDTNVILDSLLKRPDLHETPDTLMQRVADNKIKGYLCANSVTTLYYLMKKHCDKQFADEKLALLLALFDIASVDKSVILKAKVLNSRDFEDAVIFVSAELANLDAIVTRNIRDFKLLSITVVSPKEMIKYF